MPVSLPIPLAPAGTNAPPAPGQTGTAIPPPSSSPSSGSGPLGQFTDNPLFTAGFGLAILATALKGGQQALRRGADLLRRRMLVEVEVTRHDDAYPWILNWITAQQRAALSDATATTTTAAGGAQQSSLLARLARRLAPGLRQLQVQTRLVEPADGSAPHTRFALVPGQGRHVIFHDGALIGVSRQREKGAADLRTGAPFETVTLTALYAHRAVLESVFAHAHALAAGAREGKTALLTPHGTDWRPFGQPKRKRPLASVVLADGVADRVVRDLDAFLAARTWYLDRGIPYRRGYLLHGPPGTGKSSFIQALAGHFDFSIAVLNVAERGLTDDRLNVLLSNVPARSIVLLEDADAAFMNRRTAGPDGYAGPTVTFSGLLNALDGVASAEERIVFLTTNHPDRLDPALIRPGRVDLTLYLGPAEEPQVARIWDRFYESVDPDHSHRRNFIDKLKELKLMGVVSTAELQGLFLYHKDDPGAAIRDATELVRKEP